MARIQDYTIHCRDAGCDKLFPQALCGVQASGVDFLIGAEEFHRRTVVCRQCAATPSWQALERLLLKKEAR